MKSEQTHLDESAILHLVDEDAHQMQLDRWTRHVLDCAACAERLAARGATAERVRVALAAIQLPAGFPSAREAMVAARGRGSRPAPVGSGVARPWLRAAALVLLLALPVVFVPPLRAAVVEWMRQGWTHVADLVRPATPERTSASPAGDPAGYTLWFTPRQPVLEIVVDHAQRAGELVLTRSGAAEGSLEVRNGADDALLTEGGLRIRNAAESRSSYTIAVPASVTGVRVRIGQRPVQAVTAAELEEGWRTELR